MNHDRVVRAHIQSKVDETLRTTLTWPNALSAAARFSNGSSCSEGKGMPRAGPMQKGSFNICYWVRVEGHSREWVVRFPLLGMFSIESTKRKLKSEIATILFLQENTSVSVPRVIGYHLGDNEFPVPYLITESVPGIPLTWVLAAHGKKPEVQEKLMAGIAEQYLSLLSHSFDRIGCLNLSEKGGWVIDDGPLGVDIYDIARDGVGIQHLPTMNTSSEYFSAQIELHGRYVDEHKNGVFDRDDARTKYLTTRLFPSIITKFAIPDRDRGPYFLTHMDLHQHNILVNHRYEVVAILDWEFASTMPIEVACAPPKCLADVPLDLLRPNSTEYRQFVSRYNAFAQSILTRLVHLDPSTIPSAHISLAITEALEKKRAFFAWAVSDVRCMHSIFWDHLYVFADRPLNVTDGNKNQHDHDPISVSQGEQHLENDVTTQLLVDKLLCNPTYAGVDSWVEERLQALEQYKAQIRYLEGTKLTDSTESMREKDIEASSV